MAKGPTKAEEHNQYNGNVKSITLYSESGKESTIEVDIITGRPPSSLDDEEIDNVDEIEVVTNVDNNNDNVNADETPKDNEKEEYEHSLWQWPAGRGCFTKVHLVYVFKINI